MRIPFGTPLLLAITIAAHAQETPRELIARAIDSAGGAYRLEQYGAYEWDAISTVRVPGVFVYIQGTWRVKPPDSAIAATYPLAEGAGRTRRLILSAGKGWVEQNGKFTTLSAGALIEERHQFYLYQLLQLVSLRGAQFEILEAPPDSEGHPGVLVRQVLHPDVTLYFDGDARVTGLRTIFASANDSAAESQVISFDSTMTSNGVRWFKHMRITRGGKPYYETSLTSFRAMLRLTDPLLAGPRAVAKP